MKDYQMTISNDRNADTDIIALAYTDQAGVSGLRATVSWACALMSDSLGWNTGKPRKGGRDASLTSLRGKYGWEIDATGARVQNESGKDIKRNPVWDYLACADLLIRYMTTHESEWIQTLHFAATNPDSTPQERDTNLQTEIESFADYIATSSGESSRSGLKRFLTAALKPAPKAEQTEGEIDPVKALSDVILIETDKPDPAKGFSDVMAALLPMRGHLSAAQLESLSSFVTACHVIRDQEKKEKEAQEKKEEETQEKEAITKAA